MSFSILSAEHAFAIVASDIVKGAKKIAGVIAKIQTTENIVETLTASIDPAAVPLERAAYASLGILVKAVNDAGNVAVAQTSASIPTTITLDVAFINELKGLIPALKIELANQGIKI